ncbi:hypothetical protein ACFE04_018319 [Oxalis oulophora]
MGSSGSEYSLSDTDEEEIVSHSSSTEEFPYVPFDNDVEQPRFRVNFITKGQEEGIEPIVLPEHFWLIHLDFDFGPRPTTCLLFWEEGYTTICDLVWTMKGGSIPELSFGLESWHKFAKHHVKYEDTVVFHLDVVRNDIPYFSVIVRDD